MSKTADNLMAAFAGESQANRKYLAFAKKADAEGFPQAARLFRAAAEAETVHAHSHLRELGAVKSTRENLAEAIAGETHEFSAMYPGMIEQARAEKLKGAETSFVRANAVEETHAGLYRKMLDNLQAAPVIDYWVCQVCGHTAEREAPEKCPVCGAPKKMFMLVD